MRQVCGFQVLHSRKSPCDPGIIDEPAYGTKLLLGFLTARCLIALAVAAREFRVQRFEGSVKLALPVEGEIGAPLLRDDL